MHILSWVIWIIAMVILFIQIPLFFHRDPGVGRLAKRFGFLIAVGLAVTLFTGLSKFHLIWWLPVAYACNLLSFSADVNRNATKFIANLKKKQKNE